MRPSPSNQIETPSTPPGLFDALDWCLALLVAAIAAAAYGPIVWKLASQPSDFRAHASFAESFVETGVLRAPACLIHLLVALLVQLHLVASYVNAIVVVVIGSHAALAALLYLWARRAVESRRSWLGRLVPFAIAVGAPFLQPLVHWGARYGVGYLWTEPYLAPTYTLLKPFALLTSVLVVSFMTKSNQSTPRIIWLSAVVVAAGTLAKPSFVIAALPSAGILTAYLYHRKDPFAITGLMCGFVLPICSVLAWQFIRTYTSTDPLRFADTVTYRDSIVFAPLAVLKLYASHLFAKFLLSTLLPLSVVVMYPRRAWADLGLRFSLLAFVFGGLYTYLLAEQGHLSAGNFVWSGYITLLVLNCFAVVFLARQWTGATRQRHELVRALPSVAALVCQLVSGVGVHLAYWRHPASGANFLDYSVQQTRPAASTNQSAAELNGRTIVHPDFNNQRPATHGV